MRDAYIKCAPYLITLSYYLYMIFYFYINSFEFIVGIGLTYSRQQ